MNSVNEFLFFLSLGYTPELAYARVKDQFNLSGELKLPSNLTIITKPEAQPRSD